MTQRHHSLLDESLIGVRLSDDDIHRLSLPQIFKNLMRGDVQYFEGLQAHQQQPWFSFLVQVAAMATARSTRDEPPTDPDDWRELLVDLADGSEDAWHLVVDDVERPAFMQPPVPESSLDDAGYDADVPTPDVLDMLIASKTHDVKFRRIVEPEPEHWMFALISLQTLEGYSGAKNYGVVRMNGGLGNRPLVELAPNLDWGSRFRRDVRVLLDNRTSTADTHGFERDGHALLWLEPWDGEKSSAIPLRSCDPYFVEICRRIRFTLDDAQDICCWRNTTSGQRIDAPDDLNGRTGDPWTPIDKQDAKALTLGENGFTYETLQNIWMSDDFDRPPAMQFHPFDPEHAFLLATTLVRGQGKTQGWHRRIIPVPEEVSYVLYQSESDRKMLAERAKRRVELAGEVESKVLRGPIFTLVYGGRDPADPNWDKVNLWLEPFDDAVDDRFFEALWATVQNDLDETEADTQWQRILRDLARQHYHDVRDSIPLPSIHRYRVLSDADSQFESQLRNVLDRAFDDDAHNPTEESDEERIRA
jgi:CRISPR system Cascade subunit CasA